MLSQQRSCKLHNNPDSNLVTCNYSFLNSGFQYLPNLGTKFRITFYISSHNLIDDISYTLEQHKSKLPNKHNISTVDLDAWFSIISHKISAAPKYIILVNKTIIFYYNNLIKHLKSHVINMLSFT